MSIIQGTAKATAGDASFYSFPLSGSLRFDGSSYLNKSANSSADVNRYTVSSWFKSSKVDHEHKLFSFNTPGTESATYITNVNKIELAGYYSSGYQWRVLTKNLLRDTSAFYHLVFVIDRTNATAKIYINGVEAEYEINDPPASSENLYTRSDHYIGRMPNQSDYTTGYLAEINFIDGQALNPYYFGEFKNGSVWIPKQFDGTASDTTYNVSGASNAYGTNGFRLTFENGIQTIGGVANQIRDESSNSNHWTKN